MPRPPESAKFWLYVGGHHFAVMFGEHMMGQIKISPVDAILGGYFDIMERELSSLVERLNAYAR